MRASEQANLLWPFLVKKVERIVTVTGSSGSSGSVGVGGAPSPHALSSAHHTGTLTDAQGPNFLLVDGSRDLTGNLTVDSGVTIDGVDISAHVLDPDAHHARVTAGDGISVSGQIVSVDLHPTPGLAFSGGELYVDNYHGITRDANGISVNLYPVSGLEVDVNGLTIADTVAGAGLAISGKVIEVGAGDGIGVDATTVFVDLHPTPGLAFSGGTLYVDNYHGITRDANGISINLYPVSGLEVDVNGLTINDTIAGAGLAISGKVLQVGEGDGIDVDANTVAVDVTEIIDTNYGLTSNANDIRIDLATNAGLEFVSGNLALGTPSNLDHDTTNSVGPLSHTHAILADDDVSGVGGAGEEKILKSTPAGGLTLASLVTTGTVNVGEDFTAANTTVQIVFHEADIDNPTDHSHMVINPSGAWSGFDEQFGLDIDDNLLVRGWIVGKHAIQIEGAKMLVHFDGQRPANSNFTGKTTGHMGQVGTKSGGVTFREGKFLKAVSVGEATTNLVANPSFETDTTGWSTYGTASISRISTDSTAGDYCLRIAVTGGAVSPGSGVEYSVAGLAATTYTISMKVRPTTTLAEDVRIAAIRSFDGSNVGTLFHTPSGNWDWVNLTFTAPFSGIYRIRVGYLTGSGNIQIDEVQLEEKAYATPYVDGSLGSVEPDGVSNGIAWTGTAHASTSTRVGAHVSYNDRSLLDFGRPCTVMAWIKPFANTGSVQPFLSKGNFANTEGWEFSQSGLNLRVTLRNPTLDLVTTGVVTLGAWHFVAFTWNGVTLTAYLNGAEVGSIEGTSNIVTTSNFLVGQRTDGTRFNGLIDDVSLVDRMMTAASIRAIYESNAPVFAEASSWHFRSGRNRIWADTEGLWGYGASGGTIIGLYAGNDLNPSETKSWGGVSLSEGDLLLGRYGAADGGWMLFDQDLVGGDPAWIFGYGSSEVLRLDSGGASLTGVFDINTAGGIYQGTGTFASPTTGLKIANTSGIGTIVGYNAGTAQWFANTDGKLYAGAGQYMMDREGLWIVDSTNNTSSGAILGLYANTSGSKAWGGGTLENGDLLIGNTTDGFLFWDNSAATKLTISNADFTLSNGVFLAGGGKISMDVNGMWISDGTGGDNSRIMGIYTGSGSLSWGGGTLSNGDILIGNVAEGFIFWDNSAATKLTVSNANFTLTNGTFLAGENKLMMDSDGMWITDTTLSTTSGAVLGIYTKTSGTKAWGGLTLANGDILIGNTTDGYLLWDNSAATKLSINKADFTLNGGVLTAGGGFIVIDDDGIRIAGDDSDYSGGIINFAELNSIIFENSGVKYGWLSASRPSGSLHHVALLSRPPDGTDDATLLLEAWPADMVTVGQIPRILLQGGNTLDSKININADDMYIGDSVNRLTNTTIYGPVSVFTDLMGIEGRMTISQTSTTAAVPVLNLNQTDLSEEFIRFTTTVGTGNPINTTALGTYYGRARVYVAGVGAKWIALYNT